MTCIVGLVEGDRMFLGADSIATADYDRHIRKDKKIFKKNGYLIGCAGSPRLGQVLHYGCELEKAPETGDLMGFMVAPFVNGVRELFASAGCLEVQNELEGFQASILMVGVRGRFFAIYADLQVEEVQTPYLCIGSGANEAYASLWTSAKTKTPPKTRVQWAIESSATFNASVSPPVNIISMNF